MIWLAAAWGSSLLGVHGGEPVKGKINQDQSVDLSWGDQHVRVQAPGQRCMGSATWSSPEVRLRWVCDADLKTFGSVTTRTWVPGQEDASATVQKPGVAWLTDAVQTRLDDNDWDGACGLVAQFASRLQYAAKDTERADLLFRFLKAHNSRVNTALREDRPERAGWLAMDFIQSPPVWEPERPWDYMKRLRVGPPAGNRPAPERAGYLPVTPASLHEITQLAQALELGGEPRAAIEVANNVIAVAPEHAAGHLVLGDALWRQGSVEPAKAAYARASALGLHPPRLATRL